MKREFYALIILILICPLFSENTSPLGCGDPQGKPIVLYDFYHTFHRDTYNRFNSILSDQFVIKYSREPLRAVRRSYCDILVISTPVWNYSGEEIYNIRRFVIEGGGLLLMGNGWYWVDYSKRPIEDFPFNRIGREFDVTINDDGILDPTSEECYTIFTSFAPHPVTEGLTKIQSGIPSSLSITGNAVPIVRGDEDSYSGYHEPIYKAGDFPPIAAALEYGRGRILILGQDRFFSNTDIHKYDNLRFGMNIFDWLTPSSSDNDGDGYSPPSDCNDNDSDVNPGAPENCDDAIDNDCDGYTDCSDPDCANDSHCDHDKDDDGYNSTAYGGDDCNDNDSDVNPGAPENCDDAIDNDCDGYTDCSDPDCANDSHCDHDKDDDGYDSTAYGGNDCDDSDSDINPGATEVCDDNKDNDCDGYTDCSDPDCAASSHCDHDNDNDGYDGTAYGGNDCNDNDPDINPGASEDCDDTKDNDCDGSTDCSDSECVMSSHCDHDNDNDGYDGTAYGGNDCDDNDPSINPGAEEVCDGKDNDCDGQIDEGFDKDGDGYTDCNGDCNDNDSSVNPGAEEVCNDDKDNDCDGSIDCSDSDCVTSSHCDHDNDNDGYDGTAYGGNDCDDNDPDINPGATEICDDNEDNDCDGSIDCSDSDCADNSYCIDKGNLEILVVDHEGKGLKAIVYMNGSYEGETDSAGTLLISNLEADKEYTIRAEATGYNPEEKTVIVEKNTTTQVMIQMENVKINWLPIFLLLFSSIGLILLVLKFRSKLNKGTVPETRPTQMYCPHCGNKVERTWDSCTYCGCDLRKYTHIFDEGTRPY